MTEKQFEIFVFTNLSKQVENWSWSLKDGFRGKVKGYHEQALKYQKKFICAMENELEKQDENFVNQWQEDSEVFSKILELIRKAETVQKKQELYLIMKEYSEGKLTIIEDKEKPSEAA